MIRYSILSVLLLSATCCLAQWNGNSNPVVGQSYLYSYNDGTVYWGAGWSAVKGNTSNPGSSGTNYYVTVTWTSGGSGSVNFLMNGGLVSSFPVTISSCSPPATPSVTFSLDPSTCTPRNLSYSYSVGPPSGITWYWQTSATGTSTANSTTSYSVTSPGTYYVRAHRSSGNCWSPGAASYNVSTVTALPAAPANPTASTNTCGPKTLSKNGTPPGGVSWYWQGTNANGTDYTSGAATASTYPANVSGTYYLRARNTSGCWSTSSSSVAVTINDPPPAPSSAPSTTANGCGPQTLSKVGSPPSNVSWYWQGTNSGGTDHTSGAATGTTYNATTSGTYYLRARHTNGCWSASSVSVLVTVNSATGGGITSNQTICSGGDPAAFTQSTASTGAGSLSYQWESSLNNSTFSNISGATSTTYDPPSGLSQTTYYRRATTSTINGLACTALSNTITVTINSVTGGAVAANQTICSGGDPAAFTQSTASTGSGTLSYQWQSSLNNSTFNNIGGATASTYDPPSGLSQTIYYRRVTASTLNSIPCTALSNTVTVTINSVTGGTIASDQTICTGGDPASFTQSTTSTGSGTLSYQWQSSLNNSTFNNIGGATASTYDPPNGLSQTTYYKRITNSTLNTVACPSAGNTLTVTINPQSIGGTPGPEVEAYGVTGGQLTLSGHLGSVQKWEEKIGAGSWTDITNTSTTLSYSNVTTTTTYRAQVKNGVCAAVYSNEADITIYPVPSVTIQGQSAIPPGGSTTLVTDQGLYSYQWYKNDAIISGATSYTYIVTKPADYKVVVKATYTAPTYPTVNVVIGDALSNQPTPVNYILSTSFLKEGVTNQTDLHDLQAKDLAQTIQYFDGLGRPMQTVSIGSSPAGNDVVQPVAYDQYGREEIKYLPYASQLHDGRYVLTALADQSSFYENADKVEHDGSPFQKVIFEPSPLNRSLKQGAAGVAWQPNANNDYLTATDHTIKFSYETNDATEVLKWNYILPSLSYPLGLVNAATSGTPNKYLANRLFENKTKDEHQHEVITFTDKLGRVILKRVQGPASEWADTYYIYDDFGNLVTVIPPEAVKKINTTPSAYHTADASTRNTFLKLWAFRYRYDERGRMIMKQVPGAEPVYMVYDNRDRLVMTQDGNQRDPALTTKEWTFTKYDFLNRPVLTGKYLSNNDQEAMQTAVDNYYSVIGAGEAWFETYEGSTGDVLGYSNSSFPNVSAASDYYSATYYDTYDTYVAPSGYTYLNESLPGQETSSFGRVIGQVTATLVKNLTSGTFLRTVNYYDDRYRVIQGVADHHKGTLRSSNVYDFSGKLLISKRTYVVNSVTRTVKETYTYDHAGRVVNVKHSTDGATDVMIVKNEYNELGQLTDKMLHSTDGGTTFKQSVDHRYNIRGWLTKINEADVGGLASGDPAYDHFGMELVYDNTVSGLSTTQMYNGNISAIKWSKGNGGSVGRQAYTFKYDPMNRLEEASHFDYLMATWESLGRSFQEKIHQYDLNGNINKLSRREFGGMLMDSLHYSYTGNQLDYVHDYGHQSEGFVNTNTQTDDYDYDLNGNLDKDRNKGLLNKGNIKYNHLNLPVEVIKGTESIKYVYDATGRKLAQEVYTNSGGTLVKYTDYIGEMIFEGNALQFLQHPEGRVLPDGGGWEYQYHLKDHLGNVRVTFTTKPQAPVSYTANLETGTGGSGEGVYGNYTSTTYDLVDHTDAGTAYQKVQWLNGGASGRVGLTKSLSVMPGDIVSVTAYAKYMNLSGTGNSNPFAAALTAAFGVSSGSTGEQLKLYNSLNDYGLSVAGGNHPLDDDTSPKAFVTILLFDRNFNLLDAAWDQITTDLEQVSPTAKEPFDYPLTREVTVQEAGYAYIFLSNEHPTYVDVYFDDVTVAHTLSPIVSSADYYPFGLTFNSYQRENSVDQRWKFQGQEHIDDLGLNWDSFKWRNHMPDIGRFFNIDPIAEKYYYNSPYAFSENKVTSHVEIEGLESQSIHLNEEIKKAENVVRSIPDKVEKAVVGLGKGIANIPENIKGKLNGIGAFLKSKLGGLSGNRSGSTWTTGENMGNDQSDLPEGEVDGGGNIDALVGPTLKSSPAKTFMDGFFQGVEMVTTIESKTHVIKNVMKETGGNTVELKVESIQDTTMNSQNFMQLKVKTLSGKDSVIQISKTPDK